MPVGSLTASSQNVMEHRLRFSTSFLPLMATKPSLVSAGPNALTDWPALLAEPVPETAAPTMQNPPAAMQPELLVFPVPDTATPPELLASPVPATATSVPSDDCIPVPTRGSPQAMEFDTRAKAAPTLAASPNRLRRECPPLFVLLVVRNMPLPPSVFTPAPSRGDPFLLQARDARFSTGDP